MAVGWGGGEGPAGFPTPPSPISFLVLTGRGGSVSLWWFMLWERFSKSIRSLSMSSFRYGDPVAALGAAEPTVESQGDPYPASDEGAPKALWSGARVGEVAARGASLPCDCERLSAGGPRLEVYAGVCADSCSAALLPTSASSSMKSASMGAGGGVCWWWWCWWRGVYIGTGELRRGECPGDEEGEEAECAKAGGERACWGLRCSPFVSCPAGGPLELWSCAAWTDSALDGDDDDDDELEDDVDE